MKIASLVLMLAVAPLVSAQSHNMTRPNKTEVQVCRGTDWSTKNRRPALRHTAATGAFPCPKYLETTVYQVKNTQFHT